MIFFFSPVTAGNYEQNVTFHTHTHTHTHIHTHTHTHTHTPLTKHLKENNEEYCVELIVSIYVQLNNKKWLIKHQHPTSSVQQQPTLATPFIASNLGVLHPRPCSEDNVAYNRCK